MFKSSSEFIPFSLKEDLDIGEDIVEFKEENIDCLSWAINTKEILKSSKEDFPLALSLEYITILTLCLYGLFSSHEKILTAFLLR